MKPKSSTVSSVKEAIRLHQAILFMQKTVLQGRPIRSDFAVAAERNVQLLQPIADRVIAAHRKMPASAAAYFRARADAVARYMSQVNRERSVGLSRDEIRAILSDPDSAAQELQAIDAAMADGKKQHDAFERQMDRLLATPLKPPVLIYTCAAKPLPALPMGLAADLLPMLIDAKPKAVNPLPKPYKTAKQGKP